MRLIGISYLILETLTKRVEEVYNQQDMPQKALKVNKKPKDSRRITKKQRNLRKAAPLQIKSKKKSLNHLKSLSKTVSVTEVTERLVASRVGHLELIKGTRRDIEKEKENQKHKGKK